MEPKILLAKMILVGALLFGGERPSARAAEIAPGTCWVRPAQPAAPAAAAEAQPGTDAREDGLAEYGSGAEAVFAASGAALGDRLVNPRRGRGIRRRRIYRRIRRRLQRGPHRSLRRTRRRPGRRAG